MQPTLQGINAISHNKLMLLCPLLDDLPPVTSSCGLNQSISGSGLCADQIQQYVIMSSKYKHRYQEEDPEQRRVRQQQQEVRKRFDYLFTGEKGSGYWNRSISRFLSQVERQHEQTQGILRISIPASFSFDQTDMDKFFQRFGKIKRIVLKQNHLEQRHSSDQAHPKDSESLSYVIYKEYSSAVLALKVLNSIPQKERIFTAKICHTSHDTSESKLFSEPLIGSQKVEDMLLTIERDYEFGKLAQNYKYVGTIGLNMSDKEYQLRERILGLNGCNFIRVQYLCEKSFRLEYENEQSWEELVLKLIYNRATGLDREVLVMSNSIHKYNQAMGLLHELLEQIAQDYKNSKEKMGQVRPKDLHIHKWEKLQTDLALTFLT